MKSFANRSRKWLIALAAGGGLFLLEGCDPAVRETVLGGVGSAATGLSATFIEAFIQSLQADEEGTATTVKAVLEYLPQYFA